MELSILYRGPLSSCNYSCSYCPFAKRIDTREQLNRDRAALKRFTNWLQSSTDHRWRVLFTPWGEALVRSWYREAIAELTQFPNLDSVAIQTNLSGGMKWLTKCRADRLNLWATYHPSEVSLEQFVRKVNHIQSCGIGISVGVVGVAAALDDIEFLRRSLPTDVYLWVNAQQPRPRPYTEAELARFSAIDPLFSFTERRLSSLGKPCRTGEVTFTVDGKGEMRRCHFVDEVIGNLY